MPRKYGRIRPSQIDSRRFLRFAALQPSLPPPPEQADFTGAGAIYGGMLGNDRAGDCTCAGVYHLVQGWSACVSTEIAGTDTETIGLYTTLTGYDPSSGANDNGCVETDVLDYWESTGITLSNGATNKLTSYVAITPANFNHLKQAICCFGGVYLGLEVPQSAEGQTNAGQPWTVPVWSPIVGGHCVVAAKYDPTYLYVSTWGQEQAVAWAFVQRYFDAAYALINPLWIDGGGKSPGGLTLDQLTADLPLVQ